MLFRVLVGFFLFFNEVTTQEHCQLPSLGASECSTVLNNLANKSGLKNFRHLLKTPHHQT